jgi:hypothetical protein
LSASSIVCAGGIAGYSTAAITSSHNTGAVTVTSGSGSAYVGGVLGHGTASSTITGSSSTATIVATSSATAPTDFIYAGGIVGSSAATVTTSRNIGLVSATAIVAANTFAGGIAGHAGASISNSYSISGSVSATAASGDAFAGGIAAESVGISYSYSDNSVSASFGATNTAGGIVGSASGQIENCVAIGTSVTGGASTHRIVGNGGSLNYNSGNEDMYVNGGQLGIVVIATTPDGQNFDNSASAITLWTASPHSWTFGTDWVWGGTAPKLFWE